MLPHMLKLADKMSMLQSQAGPNLFLIFISVYTKILSFKILLFNII